MKKFTSSSWPIRRLLSNDSTIHSYFILHYSRMGVCECGGSGASCIFKLQTFKLHSKQFLARDQDFCQATKRIYYSFVLVVALRSTVNVARALARLLVSFATIHCIHFVRWCALNLVCQSNSEMYPAESTRTHRTSRKSKTGIVFHYFFLCFRVLSSFALW